MDDDDDKVLSSTTRDAFISKLIWLIFIALPFPRRSCNFCIDWLEAFLQIRKYFKSNSIQLISIRLQIKENIKIPKPKEQLQNHILSNVQLEIDTNVETLTEEVGEENYYCTLH